jgi:hypothetical protein
MTRNYKQENLVNAMGCSPHGSFCECSYAAIASLRDENRAFFNAHLPPHSYEVFAVEK